ncbi:TPA: matrixin family metalloprotease [Streptococcus agalactiae]
MRTLFRMIFAIPKFIFRLIWNIIWGIFKTVLVIAIILFGLYYYANHSQSEFANQLSDIIQTGKTFLNFADTNQLKNSFANLATDNVHHSENTRWDKNQATIYIATRDSELVSAYEQAISNWNATGAFVLQTTDNPNADIIAKDYSDAKTQAAGVAETEKNALTNRISKVTVKLNTFYLKNKQFGYDHTRIVNTAEHELGHALGLGHNDQQHYVMQSKGSHYGIQEVDIQTLKNLYA